MSSDPQVARVYAMEDAELIGHSDSFTPLKTLRKRAKEACAKYEVPPVTVAIRSHPNTDALYWPDTSAIWLDPKIGRNVLTLMHELAHHIVGNKNPRAQDHGATWVRVYADLLDSYKLVPLAGMRAACRKYKVRMA